MATEYNLKVDGKKVTSDNATDILENGKFSYDAEKNTLYIKGSYTATTSTEGLITSNIDNLKIVVKNAATLTNKKGPVFFLRRISSITGTKKLTVKSPSECGFYVANGAELTIEKATISIQALWGVAGPMPENQNNEKVTFVNSKVTIAASGNTAAAICDLKGGIDFSGCAILSPMGAYVLEKDVLDNDGNLALNVSIGPTRDMVVPIRTGIVITHDLSSDQRLGLIGFQQLELIKYKDGKYYSKADKYLFTIDSYKEVTVAPGVTAKDNIRFDITPEVREYYNAVLDDPATPINEITKMMLRYLLESYDSVTLMFAYTTGIENVKMEPVSDGIFYTLDGKRLDGKPVKRGIYIVDGKKVVIR